METISVAINDSSGVLSFDLYLTNIFTKSTKAERCIEVKFKLTLYCLSVTVEDLNLQRRKKDINILCTHYFDILDFILGAQ